MTLKKRMLEVISLGYIYIPILIFLFGWTNTGISIVCVAAIIFSTYRFWKKRQADDTDEEIIIYNISDYLYVYILHHDIL